MWLCVNLLQTAYVVPQQKGLWQLADCARVIHISGVSLINLCDQMWLIISYMSWNYNTMWIVTFFSTIRKKQRFFNKFSQIFHKLFIFEFFLINCILVYNKFWVVSKWQTTNVFEYFSSVKKVSFYKLCEYPYLMVIFWRFIYSLLLGIYSIFCIL